MGTGYGNLLYSQDFENQSIIPVTHSLDSDQFIIKITDTGSLEDGIIIEPLAVIFGTNELSEITIFLTSSESGQVTLSRPDGFSPRTISAAGIKFLQTAAIANIAGGISASIMTVNAESDMPNQRKVSSSFGIKFVDGGGGGNIDVNVDEAEIPVLSASNTFTGPNIFTTGISGSHSHLSDGTSYIIGLGTVSVTTGASGQIIVSGTGDGGAGGTGDQEEEILASQIISGVNADLTATLTYEPISTGSVSVYVNTAFQIQHNPSGNYVLTGATNQTIHWLGSSSLSAFDLDETDCIVVKYFR